MDFEYTEEQIGLQDSLKRVMAKNYPFDKRMQLTETKLGHSEEVWQTFAEIGALALPFPEEFNGLDGTPIDSMLVMEVLGKTLSLEPYLTTIVIGAGILNRYGSQDQKRATLPKVASGELKLAFAHSEPSNRYESNNIELTATKINRSWVLTGTKSVVLNANSADYFLVSTRTSGSSADRDGISVFIIPARIPGLEITPYSLQDGGKAADLKFNGVLIEEESLIGELNQGIKIIESALDLANAGLCAEAVGIMSTLNEITLEYLKTRKQFGVPIGKFQALQHRMADMVLVTEQARSMAILAAVSQDADDEESRMNNTAAAKAYICKAARLVGQEAIQLHGGMGVTNELNAGHYFKRLTTISLTFGDFDHHIDKVSNSLLM
jgi:alkylation response protein AidB-like acyl-CoA dehydrogenase